MSDGDYREVLDHGYVKLITKWGSEEQIIEAARMSTNKGFLGWERETRWKCPKCGYSMVNDLDPSVGHVVQCLGDGSLMEIEKEHSHPGDLRLLRYLYTNKHLTPFEMAGMTLEVQAPIFVFREWHRHRTQSYNELSARYTSLPDVNYVPTMERVMMTSGQNKQAQGTGKVLDVEMAREFRAQLGYYYHELQRNYENALAVGVPKELARLCIPVGRYS